jgi:hypothetical protein
VLLSTGRVLGVSDGRDQLESIAIRGPLARRPRERKGCCGVTNRVASVTRWSVEFGWLSSGGVGRVAPEREDVVASGAANLEEVVELC